MRVGTAGAPMPKRTVHATRRRCKRLITCTPPGRRVALLRRPSRNYQQAPGAERNAKRISHGKTAKSGTGPQPGDV